MGIKMKANVDPIGVQPELLLAVMIANEVCKDLFTELVITSMNDSKHSRTSLHYAGAAFDMRTVGHGLMSPELAKTVFKQLRAALTTDYDVLLEKDHLHIEWQRRRRPNA